MSAALFKLDMFEGPLDLLLHLITKHKLNIYDIEIAVLLEQYLEYMDGLEEEDYEDAADFLEMAARLIYIKTASLLPRDNEGEELKKELQGSLIEYSLCKMAAAQLSELYAGGEIFVRQPMKLPVNKTFTGTMDKQKLCDAYLGMSAKARKAKPLRAEMFSPIVSHRIVSVTSKIIHVLKMLITQGECFLTSMYEGCADKSERVAVFLAVLELTKSGRIFLNDDNTRVYMNSAAKKRKIVSHFDEAELEAEEAARAANYALEEVAVKSGGEDSPADGDSARENGVFSAHVYPQAMIPYHQPTTERTVYKSETRQRGTLPVLRIELSPTLQKVVDEGRQDMPEEMRAEMAAEKPEISEFGGMTVSLVKPVDADEGAAVAGDVPEKSAGADLAEKPEISEFGGVNVSLVKPVDAGEGSAVARDVPEKSAGADLAEKPEISEFGGVHVSLVKPVDAGEGAAVAGDVPEKSAGADLAEKPEFSEFGGVNVSLVKPVDADEGAAVAGDVPEKSEGADLAEKPEISEFGGANVSLVKPVDAGEGAAVMVGADDKSAGADLPEKPEISEFGGVNVSLVKPVDAGEGAAVAGDVPEKSAGADLAKKPEISQFGGVNVSLVKPVDAGESSAVAGDVPEKSAGADLAEKPEIPEFGGVTVSLVKPVYADGGAAVAMTAEGTAESEEVNGMDETAVISSDVTPYPTRENFFAMRYYWGAKNWSAYRARLG